MLFIFVVHHDLQIVGRERQDIILNFLVATVLYEII